MEIILYSFQFIWLIYLTTTFARKDGEDEYVYTVGPFVNWSFYFLYLLNKGVIIAGMFMHDKNEIIASYSLTAAAAVLSELMIVIATDGIFRYHSAMVSNGIPDEHRLVIGFVQNGVGLMAGWLSVQATMILAVLLRYNANIPAFPTDTSSVIALAVFAVVFAVVAVLDFGIWEKYTRFLFTPYIAICYGLAQLIAAEFKINSPNSILLAALIALAGFLLILKIVLAIVRETRDPIFPVEKYALDEDGSNYGSIASEAESDTSKKSEISQASEKSDPEDPDYYN